MTACALSLTLLSGCAAGSATDPCVGWQPIRPSKSDVLTDETARQILAHNEFGAARCGWRARP